MRYLIVAWIACGMFVNGYASPVINEKRSEYNWTTFFAVMVVWPSVLGDQLRTDAARTQDKDQ